MGFGCGYDTQNPNTHFLGCECINGPSDSNPASVIVPENLVLIPDIKSRTKTQVKYKYADADLKKRFFRVLGRTK